MNTRKNGFIYIILLFSVITVSCTTDDKYEISMFDNESDIYALLMHETPLGSYSFDVLDFINKDLVHDGIMSPPYEKSSGVKVTYPDESSIFKTFGTKSLTVHIGDYHVPEMFFTAKQRVYVKWAFDDSDELILIHVYKIGMK